ncbi:sulfatase [Prosthecobacter sp.]|uniref:sulfatase n=1 Tax=Prosthecobacter sp. TaxID=1965333 RepID=UPI00378456EF
MQRVFLLLLCAIFVADVGAAERLARNVLLIVSDDLTACLGCYGNPVCKTPNLDRLASQGVKFERAYCQFPVCGASRASFMSGLYPATTKMLGNRQDLGAYKVSNPELADHPSIGGLLRRQGYFSARISKIYHMSIPGGLEAGSAGGDDPDSWDWTYNVLAPETYSPGKLKLLTPERLAWGSNFATLQVPDELAVAQADVLSARQAVGFLENRAGVLPYQGDYKEKSRLKADKPFFLAVGLVRPHVPLVAPERLYRKYPAEAMRLPVVPENDLADVPVPARSMNNAERYKMSRAGQQEAIAGYYASVSFMDEQAGLILDALDRLKLRENTIVVFTSDHGYSLGEHDCWQKLSLFEESTRVPLIISSPDHGASKGRSTGAVAELVDLYPTLLELTGFMEQTPARVQGQSLRPLLEDPARTDWPKTFAYTVTHSHGESIRTERWRYNTWGDAGEELYDHENDAEEFINLAARPEHAATLAEMRANLKIAQQKAGGPPSEGAAKGGKSGD